MALNHAAHALGLSMSVHTGKSLVARELMLLDELRLQPFHHQFNQLQYLRPRTLALQ